MVLNQIFYSVKEITSRESDVISSSYWKGVTGQFVVGEKGLNINGNMYLEYLQNKLMHSLEELFPNNDFIFIQD